MSKRFGRKQKRVLREQLDLEKAVRFCDTIEHRHQTDSLRRTIWDLQEKLEKFTNLNGMHSVTLTYPKDGCVPVTSISLIIPELRYDFHGNMNKWQAEKIANEFAEKVRFQIINDLLIHCTPL